MDAVRIFTCHFFGQGEQLAGTHGWQRSGGSIAPESCLAGSVPRGGAGGGMEMRMDGRTDWHRGVCTIAEVVCRSAGLLVARIEMRADSFWL